MGEPDPIQALIEYMVKGLAEEPDAVTVVLVSQEGCSVYRLSVAPKDRDKILDQNGLTVRSMRIVLSAIGAKLNRRVSLEIGT